MKAAWGSALDAAWGDSPRCPVSRRACSFGGALRRTHPVPCAMDPAPNDSTATDQQLAPEELATLFQAAPDGIVIVDEGGRIRHLNPEAERMFGYSRAEIIGQPVETLVPEASRRSHAAHRDGYVARPHTRPMGIGMELRGRRKDGSEFPVEISLSATEAHDRLSVIAIVRDVSVRRQLQEYSARELRAAEEERRRIARELHDETAQQLSALLLHLRAASTRSDGGAPPEFLDELHEGILAAAEGVRRIARGLRPPALDELGIHSALEGHLRSVAEATDVALELDLPPIDTPLSEEAQLVLYRVVQEALANAVRHSGATRIRVGLSSTDEGVTALVEDDGLGFALEEVRLAESGALGIVGMTERTRGVGGRLDISSEPGRGTRVEIRLPAAGKADRG